jgi:molybdenum cofactor biosynthesis protein B
MSAREFLPLRIGVLTVSDTRTEVDDKSGALVAETLAQVGHDIVARRIVKDDIEEIRRAFESWRGTESLQVVVVTGGTGITSRDVTVEALTPLVSKQIPGFGELFRWLSYEEIGASTIQSRAFAGLCGAILLFALPGSTGAVRLALDRIIVPQLDHRTAPCNFAMLLPRL